MRYNDLDSNAKSVTLFQMDTEPYEIKLDGGDSIVDSMLRHLNN
jgi:hypothetical protein